jgi:GcvH upstream region-like protein
MDGRVHFLTFSTLDGETKLMLDFLRRHQRYFFFVITVVIIISFSFFGTYSTLGSNTWREQIAFKAVNGHEVPRLDVDEMALFLATDNDDKTFFGGAWGPNFLNDGVIKKDFLETGLAQELVQAYRAELQEDFDKRLMKEKKYTRYAHPQAPFLNVANVWNYFAPEMNRQFDRLAQATNGLDPDAFHARVQLFLGEREKISPQTLNQVLRFQQRQYSWLKPDPLLDQTDFALFGYHTMEDWFGPRFNRLVSEFIINAAILAEQQGYQVSQSEAVADLIRNTQLSFQQNENNPRLGVATSEEYLTHQLNLLNIDQARAVKIWRQVLLFRRYFHDAGSSALVDTLTTQRLHEFANESIVVDLYQLPSNLRLSSYDDLQNFEIYARSVAKDETTNRLDLPSEPLSVAEILKNTPELVQKRYKLEISQVNEKNLQSRIGLRQLWNWEVEDIHWQELIKQFPDLGLQTAQTRDERFQVLDELDSVTRTKVDGFAKKTIVKEHPEWINDALNQAIPQTMVIGLRMEGGSAPFSGLEKKEARLALMNDLDHAVVGDEPEAGSPLYAYTADQQNYYRIKLLDKGGDPQVLTFSEANADGTLKALRNKILEKYYLSVREKSPTLYKKEGDEWKSFSSVRDAIADQYFADLIASLELVDRDNPSLADGKAPGKDSLASLRFYPYINGLRMQAAKDPAGIDQFVRGSDEGTALSAQPFKEQWKIERKELTVSRKKGLDGVDLDEALALPSQQWSSVRRLADGNVTFFQVKGDAADAQALIAMAQQTSDNQKILGDEAQRHLMEKVLKELKEKNALSLAYLQHSQEAESSQPSEVVNPE